MIGVVEGPRTSFLDHLIPLCHLLQIPLYCEDAYVRAAAEIYYPPVELVETLEGASTLFYVEPSKSKFPGKRSVCGFHGNSDKNRNSYWIERYADEDVVLVYGDFFLDFFREKGVYERLKKVVRTGNYRYAFFQENASFFSRWQFGNPQKRRLLYAPTWTFTDKKSTYYSAVFEEIEDVLKEIPREFQVIVKLHPYMHRLYPDQVTALQERFSQQEEVVFLEEIPLIYPLLSQVDFYLGDFSSVGYDFLAFNRPLFFLQPQRVAFGRVIEKEERKNLFSILDEKDHFETQRKRQYHYAFGEALTLRAIKESIREALA